MTCEELEKKLEESKLRDVSKKQYKILGNMMVASSGQITEEFNLYNKKLIENSIKKQLFESVEQCLRKLIGKKNNYGDLGDRCSNLAETLEETGITLINQLRATMRRSIEMSEELEKLEKRLAKSTENRKWLKECEDSLEESKKMDEDRQDRTIAHLRATKKHWSAELDLVKSDVNKELLKIGNLDKIDSKIMSDINKYRLDADEFMTNLRCENVWLKNAQKKCKNTVDELREEAAVLKALSRSYRNKGDSEDYPVLSGTGNYHGMSDESDIEFLRLLE
ncbi:Hypothetical protein CINCED_3A012896 [Cinara cedri]|uniref:Uncharacterized protein n=1 Tax=Cinara cedri TaxID=506608 RepID=A0A5E4M6A0_9HEMI|nr:Hypothetical protein CINCED_3A012896 [Cinara cedri]